MKLTASTKTLNHLTWFSIHRFPLASVLTKFLVTLSIIFSQERIWVIFQDIRSSFFYLISNKLIRIQNSIEFRYLLLGTMNSRLHYEKVRFFSCNVINHNMRYMEKRNNVTELFYWDSHRIRRCRKSYLLCFSSSTLSLW